MKREYFVSCGCLEAGAAVQILCPGVALRVHTLRTLQIGTRSNYLTLKLAAFFKTVILWLVCEWPTNQCANLPTVMQDGGQTR
jgi:hypothetical protein